MSIRTRLARLEKAQGWTADTTWMFPFYDDDNGRTDVLAAYAHRKPLPLPLDKIGFARVEGPRPAVPDPAWPKPLDDVLDEDLERTITWIEAELKAAGYDVEPDGSRRADPRFLDTPTNELVAMAGRGLMT